MALGDAIAGAIHTVQTITWKDADDNVWDLSSGTLSGKMVDIAPDSTSRSITGALAFTSNGSDGEFTWTYTAADLVVGEYWVQFKNLHGDTTYDMTEKTRFSVLPIIS